MSRPLPGPAAPWHVEGPWKVELAACPTIRLQRFRAMADAEAKLAADIAAGIVDHYDDAADRMEEIANRP